MKQIDISTETANAIAGAVIGLAADEVFAALNEELGDGPADLGQVANALYDEDGLDLDAEDVAKALKAIPGVDNTDIAAALYSSKGADLDGPTIADALKDGCGLGAVEVANALYSEDGCDLAANKVAIVMDGTFDRDEIAAALYSEDGLDLTAEKVAEILHDKHIHEDWDGLRLNFNETAQTMAEAGIDATEAARALNNLTPRGGELDHGVGRVMPSDVIYALSAHYELGTEGVARVLYNEDGLDLTESEVANALYENDSLGQPGASEVAEALKGLGDLSDDEIAKVLRDDLDLPAHEIAEAIYDATYSVKNIDAVGCDTNAIHKSLSALCSGDGLGMEMEDAVKSLHEAGISKSHIELVLTTDGSLGGMDYSEDEAQKVMSAAFPAQHRPRPRDNGLEL